MGVKLGLAHQERTNIEDAKDIWT